MGLTGTLHRTLFIKTDLGLTGTLHHTLFIKTDMGLTGTLRHTRFIKNDMGLTGFWIMSSSGSLPTMALVMLPVWRHDVSTGSSNVRTDGGVPRFPLPFPVAPAPEKKTKNRHTLY